MTYHLITTADERTWKSDHPALFLGEWCRRYDRRVVWGAIDGIVAKPFGTAPHEIRTNIAYVRNLTGALLEQLADALNSLHNTDHGLRYWNIVLGHWLAAFVDVIFNRYFTVQQALESYKISQTTVLNFAENYNLATNDLTGFFAATNDSEWNYVLYARILREIGGAIETMPAEAIAIESPGKYSSAQRVSDTKRSIRKFAEYIFPKFSRDRDALIINSYLSKIDEIKLALCLGQSPQFWSTPRVSTGVRDPFMRQQLEIDAKPFVGFERFVREHMVEMLPVCYLEGYALLVQQTQTLPWPSNPRFIFTSNSFHSDEIFKIWAAEKTEQGIRYFVGQHGNNYGTIIGSESWPELATCDTFFTWGWSHDPGRQIPTFNFKTASRKFKQPISKTGVLLIERNPPLGFEIEDANFQYLDYLEDQFRFVQRLPATIQDQLTIRLYPAWRRFHMNDESRWKDRFPQLRIDTGEKSICRQIENNRLIIHSYDSTGVLETLTLNIPTLCFWSGGLDHVLDSARHYYELLEDAEILITDPDKLAEFVETNWAGLDGWWQSTKVQHARRIFCDQFSRTEKKPAQTLATLLSSRINQLAAGN